MSILTFLGGSSFKLYAIITLVVVSVGAIGGVFWYINSLQKDVKDLREDNNILKSAVTTQTATIEGLKKDIEFTRLLHSQVRDDIQRDRNDLNNLREKFNNSKSEKPRDLGQVAHAKPAVIGKIVNKGVEAANRCLEIASGAPLTEKERSAKNKTEINSVCPSLANPNYKPIN
jgi:hypothetical protein